LKVAVKLNVDEMLRVPGGRYGDDDDDESKDLRLLDIPASVSSFSPAGGGGFTWTVIMSIGGNCLDDPPEEKVNEDTAGDRRETSDEVNTSSTTGD
jgi:hypothetical protein